MTKRGVLGERTTTGDELKAARSASETTALTRLREPDSPEEMTAQTIGKVVFEQNVQMPDSSGDTPPGPERSSAEPQGWQRYELHPGVELHVREGAELPASPSFLSTLASRLRAILSRKAGKK